MKKLNLAFCLLAVLLMPLAALADDADKAAVIIIDAAGSPQCSAAEPWLQQPCLNAAHYYFKPNEHGAANTLISYALTHRFITDKATLAWQPWQNHYAAEAGAYWHIEQGEASGCIFADTLARKWAARAAQELIAAGYKRIGLVSIGPSGDERDDTALLNMEAEAERDELFAAIAGARCPAVRDRADAIMRAGIKLQGEYPTGGLIVLITAGPSDNGPYERRAAEACAQLCGRGEWGYISPFVSLRPNARARFALISIGSARDPLADALECMGARRLKVQSGGF